MAPHSHPTARMQPLHREVPRWIPASAKGLAETRYPSAKRVEWKGGDISDAEQARSDKFFSDYDKSVQDTYDRMDAHTAATWEHQRQLDGRLAKDSQSSANYSNTWWS